MAQITVTGIIKDFDGDFPSSGTISWNQSGMFIDAAGAIIPATAETCTVNPADGTFSMTLASTLDSFPSSVTYAVSFTGVIEGAPVTQTLGSIGLAPSPTSVLLKDLLLAGIGGGIGVTPTIIAADVALTLKESDQTLPAGLWRLRVNSDILTMEKNTAAAGDFSTLTEIFRSTASLFTVDIDQRISSATPRLQLYETDQAADEKFWDVNVASKILTLRTRTDADAAGVSILTITRGTGTAITGITITPPLTLGTALAIGSGGTGATSLSDILGTTNQVTVASGVARVIGGNVTLSLPQNIHTGATPQFTRLGVGQVADAVVPVIIAYNGSGGNTLDIIGSGGNASQTNALIGARSGGNCIEFGHYVSAYGSMLGSLSNLGNPFFVFNAEHGTNVDTFKTRGFKGALVISDLAGGFIFGTIATASADNQTYTRTASLTTAGFMSLGTTAPATSAVLDLQGTLGALLLPRLTTTQRDALTPSNGMIIYNTTAAKFQGYEAGAWGNFSTL